MNFTSVNKIPAESNPVATTINVLEYYKISYSRSSIIDEVETHPDFPSLHALCETLQYLGIEADPVQINLDELRQVDGPFIVYNAYHKDTFRFIERFSEEYVLFRDDFYHQQKCTVEEFQAIWGGIVVVIQHDMPAGKQATGYLQWFLQLIAPVSFQVMIGAVFFCKVLLEYVSFTSSYISFWYLIYNFLFLLGFFVSVLMYQVDLKAGSKLAKKVCGGTSLQTCEQAMHSGLGKILRPFSLSEISLVFFFTFALMFLLHPSQAGLLSIARIITLFSIPVTIVTIWYQYSVVRSWCKICLLGHTILLLLVISGFIMGNRIPVLPTEINMVYISQITFVVLVSFIALLKIKPLVGLHLRNIKIAREYRHIKFNADVVNAFSSKDGRKYYADDSIGFFFGDPESTNKIICVCSPYCEPCAQAHPDIVDFVKRNRDYALQIIFYVSSDPGDERNLPVYGLYYNQGKGNDLESLINQWFTTKDLGVFKLPDEQVQFVKDAFKVSVDSMYEWCEDAKVLYTPTLFVNGVKLPVVYSYDEIRFVAPVLSDISGVEI